jgi:hypothetical protein
MAAWVLSALRALGATQPLPAAVSALGAHRLPAQLIMSRAEPLYGRGRKVYGFYNWLEMSNYETACRTELTVWSLHHKQESVVHIAVASRMVAMGVTVAKLALGTVIEVHNTLDQLESALKRTLSRG